jgi:hypothetical protein
MFDVVAKSVVFQSHSLLVDIGTADISVHNPPFPRSFHNTLTLEVATSK